MDVENRTPSYSKPESRSGVPGSEYRDVEFTSDDAVLRGRLYLPHTLPAPIVVMAHGFSATVPMVLDRFAECFRDRGIAVFVFDHRGHGDSDGEPRGEINHWVQARGYLDAISATRTFEGFDTAPIAVWGDSFSSRVALGVAALDDRVGALVIQSPALGDRVASDTTDDAQLDVIREFLDAGALRAPEATWTSAPVVSADQTSSPSALTPLTAFRWFIEYGARYGTGWTNRVTYTMPKGAPRFDPFVFAPRVRVPTQVIVARHDEMPGASSDVTRAVADHLAGTTEVLEVDGGHFGLLEYPSALFTQVSTAEADFLTRVLRPASVTATLRSAVRQT
ncbi:alpha/beta hydrolase [Homoserinimonas sp. OAct 916]|uniref:alpha/beta hydrolase n=1 Tax=Homoserinimonas sp. OAct 916 TaxID=2211450 RepID=UPI000DBE6266|nr:alpha/beta fold hydrolase [Homoserinimonas sp. OAct 916]